jgi:hypothetical protein
MEGGLGLGWQGHECEGRGTGAVGGHGGVDSHCVMLCEDSGYGASGVNLTTLTVLDGWNGFVPILRRRWYVDGGPGGLHCSGDEVVLSVVVKYFI